MRASPKTPIRRSEPSCAGWLSVFAFQFGQLAPELRIADNVALPLLLNRVKRKEAYGKASAWLTQLRLDELGERRTGELSRGQAQRAALAGTMRLSKGTTTARPVPRLSIVGFRYRPPTFRVLD
jgi:ABC-type nitrate/sulfonate/bicarbonate transport system ATPase subunit